MITAKATALPLEDLTAEATGLARDARGFIGSEAAQALPRPGDEESEARFFPLDGLPRDIGFDNYERILRRLVGGESYPGAAWEILGRLLGRTNR